MPRPKKVVNKKRAQVGVKLEADDAEFELRVAPALEKEAQQPPMMEEVEEEEEEEAEPDQCRVCTIRSDCFTYTNIFEKMIFKNVGIVEALTMVTSLEISRDDSLPPTICCRCEQRLLDAYHFRKLAESSARGFNKSNNGKSSAVTAASVVAVAPPAPAASLKRPSSPVSPKDSLAAETKRKRDQSPQPVATVVEQPKRRGRPRQLTAAQQVAAERAKIKPTDNISIVALSSLQTKTEKKAETPSSYDRTEFEHFASEQLQLVANKTGSVELASEEVHADEEGELQLETGKIGPDYDAALPLDDDQSMLVTLEPMTQANSFKIVYEEPVSAQKQVLARQRPAPPARSDVSVEADPAQQLEIEEVELDEVPEEQDEDEDEEDGVSFLFNTYNNSADGGDGDEQRAEDGVTATNNSAGSSQRQGDCAEAEDAYTKRKHKCEVCGKRFFGRSNLVDHLRFHANVKPFKCTECDNRFVQKGSLICHMRTHTQEKPFACDVCNKRFSQASSRQIHMRTHTQERCYVCELCSKAFYSNSDLSKHRRIHDEVKKYQCTYCTAGFAQRTNLTKHMNKKHAVEVAAAAKAAAAPAKRA